MTRNDAHLNDVQSYTLSPEQLDQLFAGTTADLVSKREARLRAETWPHDVEQVLLAAVTRIGKLEARIAALETGQG